MKNFTIICFGLFLFLLSAAGAVGEMSKHNSTFFLSAQLDIPENVEIRRDYSDTIFGSNTDIITSAESVSIQSYADHRVRFQTRKNDESLYLLFTNEEDFKFPLYSAGSFIIKKDRESGRFIQVKIFILSDPNSFIRVFPWGERSRMDVYIQGYPAYRDVNLPHSFETVLTAPLSQLIETSKNSIDWSLFSSADYDSGSRNVQFMVNAIRDKLPQLVDAEDGALDADGVFRYIETMELQEKGGLNCSGFAKWVVDGIYYSSHARFLEIEQLKRKPSGLRGNRWSNRYEEERDPYFGLDWTRNLASAVQKKGSLESWDVRDIPFFTYIEDVGYPVENLPFILYYLSLTEPGHFYLASLNRPFGEGPTLRQHYHVALLFPYFDEKGSFQSVVMERTVESSMKSFIARYNRDYIHLVRVKVPPAYTPIEIN